MRTRFFLLSFFLLSFLHSSAYCAIMRSNDPTLNFLGAAQDGFNITVDSTNALQWLDFSLTTNRSFNDIDADLGAGQLLEGWRWAKEADYLALALSAGVPAQYIDAFGPAPAPTQLIDLAKALGFTATFTDTAFAMFDETGTSVGNVRLGGFSLGSSSGPYFDAPNDPHLASNQNWPKTGAHSLVGAALVRDATFNAVPEPSTFAIWSLLSLVGIGVGWRRKRKAAA